MKIMYFIHSLGIGGSETICTQYLLELQKRNVEVVLVVFCHKNSFLEEMLNRHNVKIISMCPFKPDTLYGVVLNGIYRRIFLSVESWWSNLIEKEQPDIIHLNVNLHYFSSTHFPYDKLIYTFHGRVGRSMALMKKDARRKLKCYTDGGMKFFALSNEMSSSIRTTLCTDNIVLMPNGVNIDGIRSQRYDRKVFLSELGINMDDFVIGHVARFDEMKNQARTVRIFRELLKLKPNAYLLFVGNYANEYGLKIKNMVAETGLMEKVKFLGIRDDATKIMSVFDAMLLPSVSESFSLVMIEAQAHNVRAVASMTVPESVICNDNCFRLSLDDSDEKWVYYLTGDFTEKHSYKLEEYAMDNVVDKLLIEYQKMAGL